MPELQPTIGVTTGNTLVPIVEGRLDAHYVGRNYTRAIAEAGGVPVALPAVPGAALEPLAAAFLDRVDGLLLAGGVDIAPSVYGASWAPAQQPEPERDALEVALVRGATARGIPVLGICRGMQMLNVACGGTLHEHVEHEGVEGETYETYEGVRFHDIPVAPGSLLHRVLGRERVEVMCLHHQSPDRIGEGLRVGARADDGIVEAVELDGDGFALGVQWHPEAMKDGRELQLRLFRALVEAARARRDERAATEEAAA